MASDIARSVLSRFRQLEAEVNKEQGYTFTCMPVTWATNFFYADNRLVYCNYVLRILCFQWDAIDQETAMAICPRDSKPMSVATVATSPRAQSPRRLPLASDELPPAMDGACTDALVKEVSGEFLKQIESTRIKYEAEIETLKEEMRRLVEEKSVLVEDRNIADCDASKARTEAMEVQSV